MAFKDLERRRQYHRDYYKQHRRASLARNTKYHRDNPEYSKRYYQKHRAEISAYWRQYYRDNRERLIEKCKKWYSQNSGRQNANQAKWRLARKTQVLTHYSNGKLACVRCGESRLACLSIDHIRGGGTAHKRGLGNAFYSWLINNDFPDGYQTLCMNCQFIKRVENRECGNGSKR